jgi:creatinine amidohydrolase
MSSEVRYECMRPREIVAAREACPAAYLPIGTLEWHGFHSPVGMDGVRAHALAVRCAKAGGGLVLPTLFYGESREEGLMETGAADRDNIAAQMHLPARNFAPGYMRFTPQEQYENYQRLLLHCLTQMQSLGFTALVLLAGHYPLIDHARSACSVFHQSRWHGKRAHAIAWALTGDDLVRDTYHETVDHAGFFESSLALALIPEMMDLKQQPADPTAPLVGVLSTRPIQEASAAFGEEVLKLMIPRIVAGVRDRIEHPQAYYGHGVRF